MIRTAAVPRPVRIGVAAVGVVGAIALAGCAASDTTTEPTTGNRQPPQPLPSRARRRPPQHPPPKEASSSSTYADGTYTAEGSYATPESVETIVVTVTLENDIITAVDVTGDPQKRESEEYQGRFIGGIADVVVGQDIDQISVSRVAGSSLTSGGFNQAIDTIKSEAA